MSLSISVVLFDVDGTIVDSAPAVMHAFRRTLSDFDLPIPDDRRLRTYVGPPLWHSFADLGYSGTLLADLVAGYRRRYMDHYLDPQPFAGIPPCCGISAGRGYHLRLRHRSRRQWRWRK